MHNIDPKLKNIIFKWLDQNIGEIEKVYKSDSENTLFNGPNDDIWLFSLNHYPDNEQTRWYRHQGPYPMIYMDDCEALRNFLSFFPTRHIPVIVDWVEDRTNSNLPYEVLIWGDPNMLDKRLSKGVHGRLLNRN
jgi:hypothetical protein